MYKVCGVLLFTLVINCALKAQTGQDSSRVIQFSGVVVTQDEFGEMVPLPYTSISVYGTSRGTYAEIDGFFSIVAEVGDTIAFTRVGFEEVRHTISDTLESNYYSWYQIMSRDNVLLPEAVIYPWPSREHYKIEFLALDVSDELRQRAKENLAREVLKYSGQYKPQNIFNVAAWAQFIKAWKRGDFKRKEKTIDP